MLHNKLNPIILIGIPLLIIGVFLLFIAAQLYQDLEEYGRESEWNAFFIFFMIGLTWSALSVCFLLRMNWARVTFLVLILFCILIWTGIIYSEFFQGDKIQVIEIGIVILIYGLLLLYALTLENQYVLNHFNGQESEKGLWEDILDD
ncbi:MAG: hypothetical protein DHS20C18_05920 [Saprospiraceae bacterium]|nr:MAG: hypothetical protein DHS20C18_05920 [Saprospiraceae bacterium]